MAGGVSAGAGQGSARLRHCADRSIARGPACRCDMHQAGRRIDERHVRAAGNRPRVDDLAPDCRPPPPARASSQADIKPAALVVDSRPCAPPTGTAQCCTSRRCRQAGDQHHRRVLDGEEHARRPRHRSRTSAAVPAAPANALAAVETEGARLRAMRLIADAGARSQLPRGNDSDAIRLAARP